jgi:two-component system, chemotaxis family, chemotaxis protein CheY
MTIAKAVKSASILMADDQEHLNRVIAEGVDLLVLNRVLDFGFSVDLGTDLIRELRRSHPDLKIMLVTNYPEVQAEAVQLGALPGFGKREIGSSKVADLLRNALG